eukprot:gnl/Dysnectes_brevis/6528_a10196_298.p2 GENE.gnl/Dysnectes_brevis/6528_a10196_298~~gnl/Dysnectes_brevis/6528_a10196_298.p2  ORF type:complete len:112 (-),score=27.69 gnl/Dysnectes_brevis/6528_a10196_298:195-530(-)
MQEPVRYCCQQSSSWDWVTWYAISQMEPEKVEHDSSQHYDAIELQAILLTIQATVLRLLKSVAASPILSRRPLRRQPPPAPHILRTVLSTSASRSLDLSRWAHCAAQAYPV